MGGPEGASGPCVQVGGEVTGSHGAPDLDPRGEVGHARPPGHLVDRRVGDLLDGGLAAGLGLQSRGGGTDLDQELFGEGDDGTLVDGVLALDLALLVLLLEPGAHGLRAHRQLRAQRAEMAKGIDKALVARYDQIRTRREGRALVAVKGEVCLGCDMGVPPHWMSYVAVRSADEAVKKPSAPRVRPRRGREACSSVQRHRFPVKATREIPAATLPPGL